MESPTKLHGIHVTSDPSPVYDVLRKGSDISKGRAAGKVGDLGSSGLYFSQVPQLWTGRAYDKWNFLVSLSKKKRAELADKLMKELREERDARYISKFELEAALNYIDSYVEHDSPHAIVMLAGQPYNIAFWKQEWLKPLGIKQTKPPMEIPVEAEGLFADLTNKSVSPELIAELKAQGYDGAYHRGDMINLPQSVVWNTKAIKRFGDLVMKANPKKGKRSKKYLEELIDYGGELRTRGSIIKELQKQGVPQKYIDAYMMGAKTVDNPGYLPIFAAGIASGIASGAAFAVTANYLKERKMKNPEKSFKKMAIRLLPQEGYLLYAAYMSHYTGREGYWPDYYMAEGEFSEEPMTEIWEVPIDLAVKLQAQGTSQQFFGDGYEAYSALLKAGKKANPGYADNPIQITLHRGSYPTMISSEVASILRAGRRGTMKPSDYKAILRAEYKNIGRGGGYSSGDIYKRRDGMMTLEEIFNSEIGAFILRVKRETASNPQYAPLTDEQIAILKEAHARGKAEARNSATRIFINGQNYNASTGEVLPKGINVMYQMVYWDFTRDTAKMLKKFVQDNNPGQKVTMNYQAGTASNAGHVKNSQDPTKQEMVRFLKKQYKGLMDASDIKTEGEIAIYWFANHYHGGQWTNLYSVLSTSPYSPGPITTLESEGDAVKMMYEDLVEEFGGTASNPEKPGVVWPVGAKLYDGRGKPVGVCLDTPNAIAKAMMEHPEVQVAHTLLGVKSRAEYASRMQPWNKAKSHFRAMESNPEGYYGWKNYETWNVSLWMQNDEFWHDVAIYSPNYKRFKDAMIGRHGITETPDGVKLRSTKLDRKALDKLILDLGGGKEAIRKRRDEAARKRIRKHKEAGKFALIRDNKVLFEGTENECLVFLQRHQGQSWDYAFRYGGYKLIPIKDLPSGVIRIPKGMTETGFAYNPQNTPWGRAQSQRKLAKGVTWVSTASHGGMMVSEGFAKRHLSKEARKRAEKYGKYYCYEEDVAWMIPAWELPEIWDGLFEHMEQSTRQERQTYLLEGLSMWNADYLLDTHHTPIEPQYGMWRKRQAERKLRGMKHPNLIVAAQRTDDPNITQVWTADDEIHFVTSESYGRRDPRYPSYLTDMVLSHPPTPKGVGPAGFVYNPGEMTLAEHAEAWWREQGRKVPKRNTKKWREMYEKWIRFAFKGFAKNHDNRLDAGGRGCIGPK